MKPSPWKCKIWQNFYVKQGYVTLAIKVWSEFCDFYAHVKPIYLLSCRFQIIILKTVEVAVTWTLLRHAYKAKWLSKSRVYNYSNKNLIRVLWPLCTCPACIVILLKVSNLTLKTVGEVAETWTLLCHVYKANFLNKSRIHNSSNKNLIRVLWPLYICLYVYFVASFKSLTWKL